MPKNIIVDTSCLVVLEKIEKLDILHKLYEEIFITPVIIEEYESDLPEWIHVKEISDKKYQNLLEMSVDPGEASAIALTVEIGGLVILDDRKARKLALELELDITGTLGILLIAAKSGYIESFKDILKRLKNVDFYISKEVEQKLLDKI